MGVYIHGFIGFAVAVFVFVCNCGVETGGASTPFRRRETRIAIPPTRGSRGNFTDARYE